MSAPARHDPGGADAQVQPAAGRLGAQDGGAARSLGNLSVGLGEGYFVY